MISYDEFAKVEIRAGKILTVEKIPDTDKLLKLSVDFGMKSAPASDAGATASLSQADIRQIISGIAMYFPDPGVLVGRTAMFVTNLEPRMIRGFESNGMLFAVSTADGKFSLLEPSGDIPVGTRAK